MLRLPASSISLSEKDIQFHLHQLEIYQGLLKQGFKKQEILRYYEEHRQANLKNNQNDGVEIGTGKISCVDLASRNPIHPVSFSKGHTPDTSKGSDKFSRTPTKSSTTVSIQPVYAEAPDFDDLDHESSTNLSATQADTHGEKRPEEQKHIHPHAPRKSSLLRFAERPSSDTSSSPEKISNDNLQPLIARPHKYTFLSEAQFYSECNTKDDDSHISLRYDINEEMSDLSLFEKNDESLPGSVHESTLPLTISATDSDSESPLGRNRGKYRSELMTNDFPDIGNSVFSISPPTISTPPRANSLTLTSRAEFGLASSPSVIDSEDGQNTSLQTRLQHQARSLHTPSPRNSPRSEPHNRYYHYLDGDSFAVYNDSLSPDTQPQTPAELARQPLVTEQDAAYTAPPGAVRTSLMSRERRYGHSVVLIQPDEESPTRRAMGMRERRNRELLRSIRAQSIRWERIRQQLDQQALQPQAGIPMELNGPGPAFEDQWRDELDNDRVGEENFEQEQEAGFGHGVRVISGNSQRSL